MIQIKKSFPLHIKSLNQDNEIGTIRGYASTFGNIDRQDDIVDNKAFDDNIKHMDGRKELPILFNHDTNYPIGVASIKKDEKGIEIEADINLSVNKGKEVFSLVKQGALKSFSIGGNPEQTRYDSRIVDGKKKSIRIIEKFDLMETSVVVVPANTSATIDGIKSLSTVRQINKFLISKGFTNKEANTFISKIKELNLRDEDSSTHRDDEGKKLLSQLDEFLTEIKSYGNKYKQGT